MHGLGDAEAGGAASESEVALLTQPHARSLVWRALPLFGLLAAIAAFATVVGFKGGSGSEGRSATTPEKSVSLFSFDVGGVSVADKIGEATQNMGGSLDQVQEALAEANQTVNGGGDDGKDTASGHLQDAQGLLEGLTDGMADGAQRHVQEAHDAIANGKVEEAQQAVNSLQNDVNDGGDCAKTCGTADMSDDGDCHEAFEGCTAQCDSAVSCNAKCAADRTACIKKGASSFTDCLKSCKPMP